MNEQVKLGLELAAAIQSLYKDPPALKDDVAAMVAAANQLRAENDRAGTIAQLEKRKAEAARLEERARQALDVANANAEAIRKRGRQDAEEMMAEAKERIAIIENGVRMREEEVARREPALHNEFVRLTNLEKSLVSRERKVETRENQLFRMQQDAEARMAQAIAKEEAAALRIKEFNEAMGRFTAPAA